MHWNYRIIAREEDGEIIYALHEVYYDGGGQLSYTVNPVTLKAESEKGMINVLNWAMQATTKPVLWVVGDRLVERPNSGGVSARYSRLATRRRRFGLRDLFVSRGVVEPDR